MNLAIITGTTKGLGAALRDVLAADANNLVITLSRAATTIPANATTTINFNLDVSDLAGIETVFAAVTARISGQKFDRALLINNAGVVSPVGAFDQISAAETGHHLIVNLAQAKPFGTMLDQRRGPLVGPARQRAAEVAGEDRVVDLVW